MGAKSVTGTGPGDSHKRIAYLSRDLPKDKFAKTSTNPQDLITGEIGGGGGGDGFPVTLECDPPGGDPRGFQAVDLQCCRELDSQVASGDYSFIAAGCNNTASGTWSHAEGYYTTASGDYGSHAEGFAAIASGYASHAEGYFTEASGHTAHAEGAGGEASGGRAHKEGAINMASGLSSHAEGGLTVASGDYSHAEGLNTTASGYYSHTEGRNTEATGNSSHAEGILSVSSNYASHAEGQETTASGYASHAEGQETTASGDYSHAEGRNTTASGDFSHAEGVGTTANGDCSQAGGVYSFTNHLGEWARASGGDAGSHQITINTLFVQTTDDTPTILTLNGTTPAAFNRFNIVVGKAYGCFLNVVAKTSSEFAYFTRRFLISNTTGTTVITGAVQTIGADIASAGAVTWTVTVTADNTNDVLQVEVVGDAALPTEWMAKLEATEVYNILAP